MTQSMSQPMHHSHPQLPPVVRQQVPPQQPNYAPSLAAPSAPQFQLPPLDAGTLAAFDYCRETQLEHETHLLKTDSDSYEEKLYGLKVVFLIDVSGSMQERDVDPEGKGTRGLLGPFWTRYDNMCKLLKNMVNDLLQFNSGDRIPCYFFNDSVELEHFTDSMKLIASVRQHRPKGQTAMGDAMHRAAADNLNDTDRFLFIVFTDGIPNNVPQVFQFLENEVYRRDPSGDRINFLFVRFGDDRGAMAFLKDLDDHPIFGGNVDSKSDNAAYFLGPKLLLLNGIMEHLEQLPEYKQKLDSLA